MGDEDPLPRRQLLKPEYNKGDGGKGTSMDGGTVLPAVGTGSADDLVKPTNTSSFEVIKPNSADLFANFGSGMGNTFSLFHTQSAGMDGEFICGWGAAFINIISTFPINKAIFRQQLQGISGLQAVKQLYNEGPRYLYRGLLPPLLQKTTTVSIMFGSYQKIRVQMDSVFPGIPRSINHAIAAMLAGTLEASLAPFERVQTLMQDHAYQKRFKNALHAGMELRSYGIREYYRGLTIILLRNGPSNVFFFLGREFLNDHMPKIQKDSSRLAKDFICGACLGAIISTFFFPLNVVKARIQSQLGGPHDSLWKAFQDVWIARDRKVRNLFRGFHLNYTRSFISWGIINASYEYLMSLFRRNKTSGRLSGN